MLLHEDGARHAQDALSTVITARIQGLNIFESKQQAMSPRQPRTCILGKTFVGVSAAQIMLIIQVPRPSILTSSGRRFWPFGTSTSNMSVPVRVYHEVVHPALEGRSVLYERGYADGGEERVPDDVEDREAGHKGYVCVYGAVRDPVGPPWGVWLSMMKKASTYTGKYSASQQYLWLRTKSAAMWIALRIISLTP